MSTLRFLRTFLVVAKSGTFADAADTVSLTQAAVSFQMRALEEQLNRQLFEKQGRVSVLTAAGRALVPQAQALLDQYDRLCTSDLPPEDLSGPVAFGAIVSCMAPLSRGVSRLKARHPRLDVRLSTGRSGFLIEQVVNGQLDAAIVVEPTHKPPSQIRWILMREEPLFVLAPSGAAVSNAQEALSRYPFLRFDRSEYTGRLVDRVIKHMRCNVDEFLELNSMETLVELVRQGVGVTVLPHPAASGWRNDPGLKMLPLPGRLRAIVRHIGMVVRIDHPKPRLIEELQEVCAASEGHG